MVLVNDTVDGYALLNVDSALIGAINGQGMLNYLNYTGSFGSASRISIQVHPCRAASRSK